MGKETFLVTIGTKDLLYVREEEPLDSRQLEISLEELESNTNLSEINFSINSRIVDFFDVRPESFDTKYSRDVVKKINDIVDV